MRPPAFARPVWRRLESVHTDDRADDKISGSAIGPREARMREGGDSREGREEKEDGRSAS
jgi:hypothetical protein